MTTRTIEYEEVVTQTEDIDVCNGCGRETDEEGACYLPRKGSQRGLPTLHFCSECLEDEADESFTGERAEDWMEQADHLNLDLTGHFEFFFNLVKWGLVLSIVVWGSALYYHDAELAVIGAGVSATTLAMVLLGSAALISDAERYDNWMSSAERYRNN